MLLFTLLVGCDRGSGGCSPDDNPSITIGVGTSSYEPHSSGDTAELIHGPQGGVHIVLALETTGFDIDGDLQGNFDGLISGQLVGEADPFVFLRCNRQTNTQQAWNLNLIYDDDPVNLDGQTTEVTVNLTDSQRTATATTTFVIDDPSI